MGQGLSVPGVPRYGAQGAAIQGLVSPSFDPVVSVLGSDLIEFWDAARGDTIGSMTDSTYTTAVSSWRGVLTGADLVQSTPNLKPQYLPTGLSSSPCMSFNGTSQYLTCTDAAFLALLPSAAVPSELWVVCSQDAAAADTTERYCAGWSGSSVITGRAISRIVTSGTNRARGRTGIGASATSASGTVVDFSGIHVVRHIVGATSSSLSVDGGTPITVSAVPATTNDRFRVGAISAAAASNWWQGKVAFVAVTKPLSNFKAASLRAYLG